jgi:NADH-quinone oxidoreductase subunit A
MLNLTIIDNYLPILLVITIAFLLGSLLVLIPILTAYRNSYKEKTSQYECGFKSLSKRKELFDVRFYMIGMLFIVFDIEISLLIPWALTLRHLSNLGFYSMLVFLAILLIGFLYELKKGALDH